MIAGLVAALIGLTLALKLAFAARIDLFGDEAFYWLCGQRLAPAYADHPFMAALLARAGTELLGDTRLGVRAAFLLCGLALPALVWLLARPLAGRRDALLAAGLCLCLPGVGAISLLATPDAPLLVFAALALIGLERATRAGGLGAWALFGLATALGLSTHYRFAMVPGAAALWLLGTRRGRALWRGPGPWTALLLALPGLAPALSMNVEHDFAPLHYQLGTRHRDAGGPEAWLAHPAVQALAVSPLLYAALLGALFSALRRARRGDDGATLLLCFGGLPLAVYFLASPLTDTSHDDWHWPQLGYLPLLVLAPGVLRGWAMRGAVGRLAAGAAPLLGVAMLAVFLADALGPRVIRPLRGFSGWSELGTGVEARLRGEAPPALVIADNYRMAAELAFLLGQRVEIYALDHPLNDKHGRGLQFEIWGRDEEALRARAGASALLVAEPTERGSRAAGDPAERAARVLQDPRFAGELDVDARHFDFYSGLVAPR